MIPDEELDKALPEKLRAERAGILSWLVRGCLAWQQAGLGPPLEVQAAKARYRAEQDLLGSFLHEQCVLNPTAACTKRALYDAYLLWCDDGGELRRLTLREFGRTLRERGLTDVKVDKAKGWAGLRLRTPMDLEPEDVTSAVAPSREEVFHVD